MRAPRRPLLTLGLLGCLLAAVPCPAQPPCEIPDDGSGSILLPADCPTGYSGIFIIEEGLPPGEMIRAEGEFRDPIILDGEPCGIIAGCSFMDGVILVKETRSPGLLGGYREYILPLTAEFGFGPRVPFDPIQRIDSEIFWLHAELVGDPDYSSLVITAGSDFGLPSPGTTTLTRLPNGDFWVDSFYDINYAISFVGAPGSPLDGYAGTTVGTARFHAGEPYSPPWASTCELPDNGTGTIDLPPTCPAGHLGRLTLLDGLPPGDSLTGDAVLSDFSASSRTPGGMFGPTGQVVSGQADLYWDAAGTGQLTGLQRDLVVPLALELHTAEAPLGESHQVIPQEAVVLSGQLVGDPDFSLLIFQAGIDFGLPSPGATTLELLPSGDFAVDSFFDITYRIEFEGAPGGLLEGLAGVTTGTGRFQAGKLYLSGVDAALPAPAVRLHPNTPNPFNPSTTIRYELPAGGARVALDVFDARGRQVVRLVDAFLPGGQHQVDWNGRDVTGGRVCSGIYFYTLDTGGSRLTRKMVLIK